LAGSRAAKLGENQTSGPGNHDELTAAGFFYMLLSGLNCLARYKQLVDSMNVFPVPDGDTGTNMYLTLKSAVVQARQVVRAEGIDKVSLGRVAQAVARGALMGARGNSGVILSQLLRGFARHLASKPAAGAVDIALAFESAGKVAHKAVMKPVEGTILTVASQAGQTAKRVAESGGGNYQVLAAALQGAKEALDETPKLLPVLREAGVVDAGGLGYAKILEGALAFARGDRRYIHRLSVVEGSGKGTRKVAASDPRPMVNKYCTELVIRDARTSLDEIRSHLQPLGESLLVVGDDRDVKMHIHTDNPGRVLEYCSTLGDMTEIDIDNMQFQSREVGSPEGEHNKVLEQDDGDSNGMPRDLAMVAVSPGEGLSAIFRSLSVDRVVPGGQMMNPSIEDLVSAVTATGARDVIILPNNKNILSAAQQAAALVEDQNVHVVPTRTVPQGLEAAMCFSPDGTLAENVESITAVIGDVRTGEVTYAVRDSRAGDLEIAEGDYIGLLEGDIRSAGDSLQEIVLELLDDMVQDEGSLISVYYGEAVTESQAKEMEQLVSGRFPECEVEVHYGGQPLAYYILSVLGGGFIEEVSG